MMTAGLGKKQAAQRMPPEVPCQSLITPLTRQSPAISTQIHEKRAFAYRKFKASSRRMVCNLGRILPVIVFLLVSISLLRFVRILITTSSNHTLLDLPPRNVRVQCASPSAYDDFIEAGGSTIESTTRRTSSLTEKEFMLLADLVKRKAPCNLLIFGLNNQYLNLSSLNDQGMTIILEDDPSKLRSIFASSNTTRIFQVKHFVPAKRAYNLLKHARKDRSCLPGSSELKASNCILALRGLPHDVYKMRWDIIIVDGPRGDTPEVPGRMMSIYTASMLARAGNSSHVVVHDVDRTIEKWFSWDFLCEENLVSSKGMLWVFRIQATTDSTSFCVPQIA